MSRVALGGHRGMGCTDHDRYQTTRAIDQLPVENTVDSVRAAFAQGAAYVEIDAVMSGDGQVFTLHNVVPRDHFFDAANPPSAMLNQMAFADIRRHKAGRFGTGEIAPFDDMLAIIAALDPQTLPWAVNIEIKGVQGSGQNYETNDYLDKLADAVRQSSLPAERVLFSSFSLQNIIAMSCRLPQALYGMLFADRGEVRGIYADRRDDMRYQYLQFDPPSVGAVCGLWSQEAHRDARLDYLHPEILTLTEAMLAVAATRKMGVNAWALFEELTPERAALYTRLAAAAEEKGVALTVITDYLPEMRRVLEG
jgi:glycerophosphoryl diester phosphodiesterase